MEVGVLVLGDQEKGCIPDYIPTSSIGNTKRMDIKLWGGTLIFFKKSCKIFMLFYSILFVHDSQFQAKKMSLYSLFSFLPRNEFDLCGSIIFCP